MSDKFKALVLDQKGDEFTREVKSVDKSFLKHGDVTIKVDYSDLNFKDGMILKNGGNIWNGQNIIEKRGGKPPFLLDMGFGPFHIFLAFGKSMHIGKQKFTQFTFFSNFTTR